MPGAQPSLPRVVIVDDHAGFRAEARAVLESEGYRVIGEAADGELGCALVRELRPDLVLVDVALPGMDGFETAERIGADAEGSRPAVVLVSSRDADAYGPRIARSGARGFVAKDELSGAVLTRLLERS